jgi:hypothetical protein
LSAALEAGTGRFTQTTQPGLYEVTAGARSWKFAVNLDANESRTAPLGPDELEQLGVPVAKAAGAATVARQNRILEQGIEAENRQKLWRWLLAGTLAVLLAESALAGWTARRRALEPNEATS